MFNQYIPSCLAKELAMVIQDFLRTGCVVPYQSASVPWQGNGLFSIIGLPSHLMHLLCVAVV